MSPESLLKRLSQLTLRETRNLFQENTPEVQELVGTGPWREAWPLISETLSPGLAWPQKTYCRLLLMAEGKEAGCAMEDWPCVQREQVRASEEQLLCDT